MTRDEDECPNGCDLAQYGSHADDCPLGLTFDPPPSGNTDPVTGQECMHTHAFHPGACLFCERDHALLERDTARAELAALREAVEALAMHYASTDVETIIRRYVVQDLRALVDGTP